METGGQKKELLYDRGGRGKSEIKGGKSPSQALQEKKTLLIKKDKVHKI